MIKSKLRQSVDWGSIKRAGTSALIEALNMRAGMAASAIEDATDKDITGTAVAASWHCSPNKTSRLYARARTGSLAHPDDPSKFVIGPVRGRPQNSFIKGTVKDGRVYGRRLAIFIINAHPFAGMFYLYGRRAYVITPKKSRRFKVRTSKIGLKKKTRNRHQRQVFFSPEEQKKIDAWKGKSGNISGLRRDGSHPRRDARLAREARERAKPDTRPARLRFFSRKLRKIIFATKVSVPLIQPQMKAIHAFLDEGDTTIKSLVFGAFQTEFRRVMATRGARKR